MKKNVRTINRVLQLCRNIGGLSFVLKTPAAAVLACLLLFAAPATVLAQNDYYLSASLGADIPGSGAAVNTPFKTIRYALANTPSGGILHIDTGTYKDTIRISTSVYLMGTIKNGKKPVFMLPNTGRNGNQNMLRINDAQNVTIENIHFEVDEVFTAQVVAAYGNFNHLTLKNVNMHHYGSIYPLADTNRNLGKILQDYQGFHLDGSSSPYADTISVTNCTFNGTIAYDTLSTAPASSLDRFGHSSLAYANLWLKNVTGTIGGPPDSFTNVNGKLVPVSSVANDMTSIVSVVAQDCEDLKIQGNIFRNAICDLVRPRPGKTYLVESNSVVPNTLTNRLNSAYAQARGNANIDSWVIFRSNNFYGMNGIPRDATVLGGGIISGGNHNVIIEKNLFQPEDTALSTIGVVVDSKFDAAFSPPPSEFVSNNIIIRGNRFAAPAAPRSGAHLKGILFKNGFYRAYPLNGPPAFDYLDVGGDNPADFNLFAKGIKTFATTFDSVDNAFTNSVNITRNTFVLLSGDTLRPSLHNLNSHDGLAMEDQVTHYFDNGSTGRVRFNPFNTFLTGKFGNNNFKRCVDSTTIADTVFCAAINLPGTNSISRNLNMHTEPGTNIDELIMTAGTLRLTGPLTINNKLDLTAGFFGTVRLIPRDQDTVYLGPSANYIEGNTMFVVGHIKATRTVGSGQQKFGGMGLTMEYLPGRNAGSVTLVRTSFMNRQQTLTGNPYNSIDAMWSIKSSIPLTAAQPITLTWKTGYERLTGVNWTRPQAWGDPNGDGRFEPVSPGGHALTGTDRSMFFWTFLPGDFTVTQNPNADTTGISEGKGTSFSMYPNPARSQVRIAGNFEGSPVQVRVINASGREVLKEESLDINTDALKPGLYLVQVTHLGRVSMARLVIE
ncbi:MAG: T9SS type A sorting domain-containing protein [Bacteroidota bacterium]